MHCLEIKLRETGIVVNTESRNLYNRDTVILSTLKESVSLKAGKKLRLNTELHVLFHAERLPRDIHNTGTSRFFLTSLPPRTPDTVQPSASCIKTDNFNFSGLQATGNTTNGEKQS